MLGMLFAAFLSIAQAGTYAGVTMPDSVTSDGGQALVLNGMGLREKFFFDIYVGGLYLPAKTTDASTAINQDVPKRIVMKFVYSKVTKQQMIDTFRENFQKNPAAASLTSEIAKLEAAMDSDIVSGDQVVLDYVPGKGTTVIVKGTPKVTIPGAAFMKALWTIYLGPSPAYGPLKDGMLGNK
ncbi:MAG TPA: chalcone isomerase family protein [Myxococcota bacterium]|nr:chalcone isomerase family protein [Myxococcota bacterium]